MPKNPFLRAAVERDFEKRQEEIDRREDEAEVTRVGGTLGTPTNLVEKKTDLDSMPISAFNSQGSDIPENDPPVKDNFKRTVRAWREPGETARTNY